MSLFGINNEVLFVAALIIFVGLVISEAYIIYATVHNTNTQLKKVPK
jgi:hypothetical protein